MPEVPTGSAGPAGPNATGRPHRHAGDAWVECPCGRRHWGTFGAAGLLLHRDVAGTRQIVLQHRALWSDHGGTWGLPGGALAPGESAEQGAVREAVEEAGIDAEHLAVDDTWVLDHGVWRYTTVIARTTGPQDPRPTDPESLAIEWVDVAAVADHDLLPAFAAAWPELLSRLGR